MCYAGSCEFFLSCWMSGGLVEEGCGGFLFACCNRPGRAHYSSFTDNHFRDDPRGLIPFDLGPVVNDPGKRGFESAKKLCSLVFLFYLLNNNSPTACVFRSMSAPIILECTTNTNIMH